MEWFSGLKSRLRVLGKVDAIEGLNALRAWHAMKGVRTSESGRVIYSFGRSLSSHHEREHYTAELIWISVKCIHILNITNAHSVIQSSLSEITNDSGA